MDELGDPRTDRLAAILIEKLCLDFGCAVNTAVDDQNGWDLIVEFPVLAHAGPADTRPPALKCFVQVKSTQTTTASVRIKLSNAVKLAKNPLPCFTALVMYAEDGKTPTNIYLQHFDQPQIAQALKAARQAHADGDTALNQMKVTLCFTSEELTPEDEVAMRMARAIPRPATYGAAKDAYASEVGYESGYGRGKLSFSHEQVESFVDAMLGKDVAVQVEHFSFRKERFGIVDSEAVYDGPGTIKLTPTAIKQCRVVVRLPDSNEQIVLPGEIFVPGIPDLPEEYRKMRVHTDILEFTCARGQGDNVAFGDFTASFGTHENASIDRLDQLAALWSWFEAGPLELELWVDGSRFLHGQIETGAKESGGYWRAVRFVTSTLANFVDKDLRPANMEFSLSDFAPLTRLVDFAEAIGGAGGTLNFSVEGEFPAELRSYVTPIFLEFGPVVFFAVARYRVKSAVVADSTVTIELADPSIQRKAILGGTLADHAEFAREETRAMERSCAKDGEDMVFGFLPEALMPSGDNRT